MNRDDAFDLAGWKIGLCIAIPYLILGIVYILASSYFALHSAVTAEDLMRIEIIKGCAFILFSSTLIFLLSHHFIKKIQLEDRRKAEEAKQIETESHQTLTKTAIASIAHDSNNMLGSIILGVDLVSGSKGLDENAQRQLQAVSEAATELSRLNNRLMESSDLESHVHLKKISVSDLFACLTLLQSRHPSFSGRNVTYHIEKDVGFVNVDKSLFVQALFNVLLNAAEATGQGGSIECRAELINNHRISFAIHDDGPGVPAEKRKAIFRPYFSDKKNGHGFGLMNLKACARAFSGSVEVEDSPLGGACFKLTLLHLKDVNSQTPLERAEASLSA